MSGCMLRLACMVAIRSVQMQVQVPKFCTVQDKKKIEADEPVFGLASVDLVEVEAPTWHIAEHLPAIRCTLTTGSY